MNIEDLDPTMDIEENVVLESEASATTSTGKRAMQTDSDDEWPNIKKHVVAMKRVKKPSAKQGDSDFIVLKAAFPEFVVTSVTSSLRSKRVKRDVAPVTEEEVEEEEGEEEEGEEDEEEEVDEELGYKCQQCDYVVKTKKGLDCHMKAHVRYKCCICEQLFSSMLTLTQHAVKHDENWRLKAFICCMCAKAFPNRASLAAHEAIHSKPDSKRRRRIGSDLAASYRCDHCGREFRTLSMLGRHMPNHSTEKTFSCSECPKMFKSQYHLKNHAATHVRKKTGAKPYKCDLCHKFFGLLGSLKSHIARHSRGPIHKCSVCKQVFTTELNLEQHMWTHASEKQFVCVECFPSKRFAAATGLARHWKLRHAASVPKNWTPRTENTA